MKQKQNIEIYQNHNQIIQNTSQKVKQQYSQQTTLIFLFFAFYFLIFALIEFITNAKQTYYSFQLICILNNCTAKTPLTFSLNHNISIYLIPQDINQNDFFIIKSKFKQFLPFQNLQFCQNQKTNQQLGILVSPNNKLLNLSAKAIPCGNLAYTYPKSQLYIYSIKTNSYITVNTENINNPYQKSFQNINIDEQWVDMKDPRFINWMQISTLRISQKLWGTITAEVSGQCIISLLTQNEVNSRYNIVFQDNKSLAGFNPELNIFNFCLAGLNIIFSLISYTWNDKKLKSINFHKVMPIQ